MGTTGAAAVGASAATGPAAAGKSDDCDPEYSTPVVYTADHIDTNWYGDEYITSGNTTRNYERAGPPFPDSPDEILVHIHGWRNNAECGFRRAEQASKAYAVEGYDGFVTGLVWDSAYAYWNAKDIAEMTAPKLASFLADYKDDHPDTTIRVQSHSMGALVAAETMHELDKMGRYDVVTTLVFYAGAINNESVAVDGRYGPSLERVVQHVENFVLQEDAVLDWAYTAYEFSKAIGNDGCDGTPPANYTDHTVDLDDHSDAYKPRVGLAAETMATFEEESEGSNVVDDDESNIDHSDDDDDDDSWCFITTATAREPSTLNSLRRFRDDSMASTPVGRFLVWLYYAISPPIAETLERNPHSRTTQVVRSLVQYCAGLSDRQAATDSRLESAALGTVLTLLYVVGILIAAGGHAVNRTATRVGSRGDTVANSEADTLDA